MLATRRRDWVALRTLFVNTEFLERRVEIGEEGVRRVDRQDYLAKPKLYVVERPIVVVLEVNDVLRALDSLKRLGFSLAIASKSRRKSLEVLFQLRILLSG